MTTPATDTPAARSQPSPRYHDLDALRATAMLLGVVLHASLFLIPDAWPIEDAWAGATNPEANPYGFLLSAIHGFRMPVFFLLSGFFTAMLWQRRGLRELAAHRLKRIGIPLAIGCLTIIPINVWMMFGSKFEPIYWPILWLESLHHLWFLWLLLLLVAVFIGAARPGLGFNNPLWWLAIPATVAPQLLMSEPIFGPDTSDTIAPDPVVFAYYALFFGFGAFLYSRGVVMRRWWAFLAIPALAGAFLPGLYYLYETREPWAWALSAVLQVAYAWLMCFGSIGIFHWLASRERFWVRYLSDASYWIYLWHLPLILVGQRILVDWPISPHLKFAVLCLLPPIILLVVYRFGVRYTPVGNLLNGPRSRRPRVSAPRAARPNI